MTAYNGYGLNLENPGEYLDLKHHLLCFDKNSGQPVWQREIRGTHLKQTLNPELIQHGFASSTPVTDGDQIYAWFGVTGVFAFDAQGGELWQRNLGLETNYFGSSASLLVYQDLLIVNASIESNTVYALDKKTGAVVWWIPDIHECWSMPVIGLNPDGQPEMVISSKNTVAGYDPASGRRLWHCAGIQDYVVSTPVIVEGVCYLSGGKQKQTLAVRLGGSGDVENTHKIWEQQKVGSNVSSPVWHDGRLYIFHDNGIVQVINADTGAMINRHRTATQTRPFASPLLAGDRLYMPFQDAGIAVFQADEQCGEIAVNALPDTAPLMASIAAAGDRLYFRSDRYLYCIESGAGPASVTEWSEPDDRRVIATLESCLIEPDRGWTRRFLLFLTPDYEQTIRYLLMPYQSVITDDQTIEAQRIIREEQPKYEKLRDRFETLEKDRLQTAAAEIASLRNRYEALEEDTRQLSEQSRILVKKLFTEEQMQQHLADAAEGKAHLKPTPR